MQQFEDAAKKELDDWINALKSGGLRLAILLTVSAGCSEPDAIGEMLSEHTSDIMKFEEGDVRAELSFLESRGLVEREGQKYCITRSGKKLAYDMIRQWNRYVDSMNNIWGCFYFR